jgi:hypothetical protein
MRRNLTGWFRLGLATSVLWLVATVCIATVEYVRVRPDGSVRAFTAPDLAKFSLASRHGFFDRYESRTFTFEQAKGEERMHDVMALRFDRFGAFSLLPISALWLVGFLARWVIYGFHSHKRAV